MHPDEVYQLLRNLTSPVVAITAERDGKRNGMIADSAVRASIVPAIPRVSVYIHKFNYSHDMIFDSGRFGLHLLRDDQFELIHRLGFTSGRARDKLADVPHHVGTLGAPVLDDCHAYFECRSASPSSARGTSSRSCGGDSRARVLRCGLVLRRFDGGMLVHDGTLAGAGLERGERHLRTRPRGAIFDLRRVVDNAAAEIAMDSGHVPTLGTRGGAPTQLSQDSTWSGFRQ